MPKQHKSYRTGKSRILSRNESVCHAPENRELATSGQSGMGSPEISPMHKDGEPYSDNDGE